MKGGLNMKWTKKKPEKEGWYFWRRANTVKDEFKYKVYFVLDNNSIEYTIKQKAEDGHKFSVFEGGDVEVLWPKGGWWIGPILI